MDEIGLESNIKTKMCKKKWMDQYRELVSFKEVHGHCNGPFRVKNNEPLGQWVNVQRRQIKDGTISGERKALLDHKLGLQWMVGVKLWRRTGCTGIKGWLTFRNNMGIAMCLSGKKGAIGCV